MLSLYLDRALDGIKAGRTRQNTQDTHSLYKSRYPIVLEYIFFAMIGYLD